MLKDVREPIAGTVQHGKRVDDEYERAGTANIFMFTEPRAGLSRFAAPLIFLPSIATTPKARQLAGNGTPAPSGKTSRRRSVAWAKKPTLKEIGTRRSFP
ncbi:MAG: hypothetical protein AB7U20_15525 [Planctomycetaceae bacterium]